MASVLLRLARLDPLQFDAQAQPPDRERAQASQPRAGKGRPVVGSHPPGHSILPKGGDKERLHRRHPGGSLQALAAQEVATVAVADRQRRALTAVAGAKPAFEVRAPGSVGLLHVGERLRVEGVVDCSAGAPWPLGTRRRAANLVPHVGVGGPPGSTRADAGSRSPCFRPATTRRRGPPRVCAATSARPIRASALSVPPAPAPPRRPPRWDDVAAPAIGPPAPAILPPHTVRSIYRPFYGSHHIPRPTR